MAILYFISPDGRTVTTDVVKRTAKKLTSDNNLKENQLYCRAGPSINDPVALLDNLLQLPYDEWEIIYVKEGSGVMILNVEEKVDFITQLKNPDNRTKSSGEILKNYLT